MLTNRLIGALSTPPPFFGNIRSPAVAGTGASGVSSNTLTLTLTQTVAADDFVVLTVAADNISTADAASSDHTSVTGGTGTWSKLGEFTNGNGAADAGVTTSLWLFDSGGSNPSGSTTFTINFGANVIEKCAHALRFTVDAGVGVRLDADAPTNPLTTSADLTLLFGSLSFSGLPSKQRLYFRAVGVEYNAVSEGMNSGSGTGFTATGSARSANNPNAIMTRSEFRIFTGTGATSNPFFSSVEPDSSSVFVAIEAFE